MPSEPFLLRAIRHSIAHYHMVRPGSLLLVAVSGGADSTALLDALHALAPSLGIRLHAAHLNHCLRGAASDADAEYVDQLCRSLGIPATIECREVASIQQRLHTGAELAARLVRYAFLAGVAAATGAAGVFLGHTADDQAETLLLHLIRGAGLPGLQAMLPVSEMSVLNPERPDEPPRPLRLLRPMLDVSRVEVEEYCRARSLEYRIDASNFDLSIRRNWIRHQLLPLMEQENPAIRHVLSRSTRLAAQDLAYLQGCVQAAWPRVIREDSSTASGSLVFDLSAWRQLHPVEQRYVLREAARRLLGSTEDLGEVHIEEALQVLEEGQVGASTAWPRGIRVVKDYRTFLLTARPPEPTPAPPIETPIAVPGTTSFGPWTIRAQITAGRCPVPDAWHADLDYRAVIPGLTVRARQTGDRLQPLGMEGEKKLQDLLVDARVPRAERDTWPVVVSSGRIAWVPGVRMAAWPRVRPETEQVVCLTVERASPPPVGG